MLYSDYKDDKLTREEYVKRSKAMVDLQCLAYCGKGGAFRGNSHGAVYHRKDQKEGHRLHLQGGKLAA